MVDGNGHNPGRKEILAVGIVAGMKKRHVWILWIR